MVIGRSSSAIGRLIGLLLNLIGYFRFLSKNGRLLVSRGVINSVVSDPMVTLA
jgi:hypothetical protein